MEEEKLPEGAQQQQMKMLKVPEAGVDQDAVEAGRR
jgi:hypothetical protein